VELKAAPDTGAIFTGWDGNCFADEEAPETANPDHAIGTRSVLLRSSLHINLAVTIVAITGSGVVNH